MIARGDAEIGFQQISELLPVKGIDYLGPLPADIQEITLFSAALHREANPSAIAAARALLQFLVAPAAAPVIRRPEWSRADRRTRKLVERRTGDDIITDFADCREAGALVNSFRRGCRPASSTRP